MPSGMDVPEAAASPDSKGDAQVAITNGVQVEVEIECEDVEEEPDLTQSGEFTDLILIVEGKKLHFSRRLLCLVSPVFKLMFNSDYKEKSASELPLPGKTYEEIHTLLRWILPSVRCAIEEDNVHLLLPLSEEYHITCLREDCVDFLVKQLDQEKPSADTCLEMLALADLYQIKRLTTAVAEYVKKFEYAEVTSLPRYVNLMPETRVIILQNRMKMLETSINIAANRYSYDRSSFPSVLERLDQHKTSCETNADLLTKTCSKLEKTKKAVEDLRRAWNAGESASCSDHAESKRNLSCSKCTQLFGFRLKSLVSELTGIEDDRYAHSGMY